MKEILRSLRNEHNYSQSAVASYLEVSRQMYNKYENGTAEPSIKNIKKLCSLYKVSADVFFKDYPENTDNTTFYRDIEDNACLYVASPTVAYKVSENKTEQNLLNELIDLLPNLKFSEQIFLMSRLASIIEQRACMQPVSPEELSIKPKKQKKIPDAEYSNLISSEEAGKIQKSSLATIRELLKNEEW